MPEAVDVPRIWPTLRERLAWAWREIPEFHNWRKAAVDSGIPFVASLVVLRHFLDPQGWRDEVVVAVTSLVIGFVAPTVRLGVNFFWRAPRRIVRERFDTTWRDYLELKGERERLLSERIEVEIEGFAIRRANLPGTTVETDGRVYVLRNTIITNRSDVSVSLSFELWLPGPQQGSWLILREQEHSEVGRGDPHYIRSPVNIGAFASSECKDIGFVTLPGEELLPGTERDPARAVLRVIERVSRKTFDVPVRQRQTLGKPPDAP
jgi:hypothetical protein